MSRRIGSLNNAGAAAGSTGPRAPAPNAAAAAAQPASTSTSTPATGSQAPTASGAGQPGASTAAAAAAAAGAPKTTLGGVEKKVFAPKMVASRAKPKPDPAAADAAASTAAVPSPMDTASDGPKDGKRRGDKANRPPPKYTTSEGIFAGGMGDHQPRSRPTSSSSGSGGGGGGGGGGRGRGRGASSEDSGMGGMGRGRGIGRSSAMDDDDDYAPARPMTEEELNEHVPDDLYISPDNTWLGTNHMLPRRLPVNATVAASDTLAPQSDEAIAGLATAAPKLAFPHIVKSLFELGPGDDLSPAERTFILTIPDVLPATFHQPQAGTSEGQQQGAGATSTNNSSSSSSSSAAAAPATAVKQESGSNAPFGGLPPAVSSTDTDGLAPFVDSFSQLSVGTVGRFYVHESGRMRLRVGNVPFDVLPGTAGSFLQSAVVLDAEHGQCISMDNVRYKLIAVPDLEHLIDSAGGQSSVLPY